ncbi:MAG TPA: ribosome biogenesis GTP-binding protein YihA/YsxC [Beijerinckiaceae bacterium]|nr:ribosome biogenesis GTP-binding protein YihA/YsxC [Beijerinckiaceae bacterium]
MWAAATSEGLPPPGPPEIAFAGRSNVGKSSLLNALTNRLKLARTSQTPGRTRELNFFALGQPPACDLRLVDMPGYGYAAAGKALSAAWTKLIGDYLRGRASLARVFLLVDGRHGLKPIDAEIMDMLDRAAVSYQLVLTKRDEVKPTEAEGCLADTLVAIAKRPAAFPNVLFTSARSGEGIAELRAVIARLIAERHR